MVTSSMARRSGALMKVSGLRWECDKLRGEGVNVVGLHDIS